MSNQRLGKGLSALISSDTTDNLNQGYIPELPIEKIIPNRYQPRIDFHKEKSQELLESVKEHGIIEPLIVTKKKDSQKYELIAGERRLNAAREAGLETVPVVVKEASPQQMLELAVVENVQRADLNPLEEGLAFNQLAEEFGMSHSEISEKIGLSRPAVANKVRLLKLPEQIKQGLIEGAISEGHARAILGLEKEPIMIRSYKKCVANDMSVRATEELVRRLNQGHKKPKKKTGRIIDQKTVNIETSLKERFNKKVKLRRSKKGGKITIPFSSDDELDNIFDKLMGIRSD